MKNKQFKTYVGADLHKNFTHFIAQNRKDKETASRKIDNNGVMFREFLKGLPQPVKVIVESTSNWAWLCQEVKTGGREVLVAHARETSAKSVIRETIISGAMGVIIRPSSGKLCLSIKSQEKCRRCLEMRKSPGAASFKSQKLPLFLKTRRNRSSTYPGKSAPRNIQGNKMIQNWILRRIFDGDIISSTG